MNSADERLDRLVEAVQQVNIHLEGLRVSLGLLVQAGADHEQRLRTLERWRHHLTPVLAAVTFVLGAVCTELLGRMS